MSSKNIGRIKQIKPKQYGQFPDVGIPIGTDGLLVDMISQLDLEQEIRLGGNHYVDIKQTPTETTIKQWYFSESKGNVPIEEVDDSIVTYTVKIRIVKAIQTVLGSVKDEVNFITWKNDSIYDEDNPLTYGDFLINREEADDNELLISLTLYKGNFETILHEKRISIYENSNGQIAIDEQVDQINSINPF